jgi:SAM-dependent methyltransferase
MLTTASESHRQAQRLFDDTADYYVRRSSGAVRNFSALIFQRRISIVESFIRQLTKPGDQVLDYGMGPAVFGPCCTKAGLPYLGVDVSPEMVNIAKRANLPNSKFIVGDLETLADFEGQMDLVLAIGLIDYLEDMPAGIARLAACVKPGGHLVVSFRNRYSVPSLLRDFSKVVLRPLAKNSPQAQQKAFFAKVHEKSVDVNSQLLPQFEKLGFGNAKTQYFNCSPFFFNFPMPRLIWRPWLALDERMAGSLTRWMCSGGVVAVRRPGS